MDVDWTLVTGVSSTAIALCALGLSVWQGYQARKHNRLAVRPHLTTWSHSDVEERCYAVEVMNNGIGPALIESFSVQVDGTAIPGEETEAVNQAMKIVFRSFNYRVHVAQLAKGYSMPQNERRVLVSLRFVGPEFPTDKLVERAFERCDLEIKYKSFYEEQFVYSSRIKHASQ